MFTRQSAPFMSSHPEAKMDDTAFKAIRAAHRRKWTSILTVAAVILAGVGVTVYSSVKKERNDARVTSFLKAETQFQLEREAFIKKIQEQKSNSFDISMKPDHSASAKLYEAFAQENSYEPIGWVAALKAASAYTDKGDLDGAARLLESILPKTLKHNLLQVRVRRALAGIYADKGDYKKAISELELLEKVPDNPVLGENRLFEAKIHYLAGDREKAGKILRDIANNPEFSLGGERNSAASEASLWLGYWGL